MSQGWLKASEVAEMLTKAIGEKFSEQRVRKLKRDKVLKARTLPHHKTRLMFRKEDIEAYVRMVG